MATSAFNRLNANLPVDSPARRRLPALLRQAWYSLNQAFRRRIAENGVTPDQFTVMRTLLEGDPRGMTQRELVETMASDPNTITGLLDRMENAGWIERRRHEADRRAYRIRMNQAGKEKYQSLRVTAVSLQSEILEVLPADEREHFLANLDRVAEACRHAATKERSGE